MVSSRAALVLLLLVSAGTAQIQGQALKARSAVDAVEAVPYLSTLLSALKAVNLSDALGPTFNGTLVAPQDSGFANLTRIMGLSTPADLLTPNNSGVLTQILQYHVVPGAPLAPQQLQTGQKLPTLLANEQLTIDRTVPGLTHIVGGTPYNIATLLGYQSVKGEGAVVFVVDQVLLPSAIINSMPQLSAIFQPALGH